MSEFSGYRGSSTIKKTDVDIEWTPELEAEYIKCAEDPIYFAQNYIKVVNVDHGLMTIDLYDYQHEMITAVHNERAVVAECARQSGKTTAITCSILHYVLFNEHKNVAILANKAEVSREILSRIKLAYEHLPQWLQQGVVKWNEGSIHLENGCKILATATSSNNIRGFSVNLLFIDEAAFVEHWDEFYTSVLPTISSGKTTKIVLVSTVNGLNHFHEITSLARKGLNGFKLISITWKDVPGRDQAWKDDTLSKMSFNYEKFAQEYENEYLGSSGTLISGSRLKQLAEDIQIPQYDAIGLKIYEEYKQNHEYVMTCDVSRGKGLDYSAFQLIDVSSMPYKQVATFRSNVITPVEFTEVINRIGRMYGDASCLIEVNDIGAQVSDLLFYDYEYENILFTATKGSRGKTITSSLTRTTDKGIRTTLPVKNIGCSILKLLVEQDQLFIQDSETVQELATFSKKGKSYEAEEGKHDDLTMCLVLFAWLTEQPYFKMFTDINTLSTIREMSKQELEDSMTPAGFLSTGLPEDSPPDLELEKHGDEHWFTV